MSHLFMPNRQPAPARASQSFPSASSRPGAGRDKPKSHKADGSAKVRWNADERSSRGRPPRRSSGRADAGPEQRGGEAVRQPWARVSERYEERADTRARQSWTPTRDRDSERGRDSGTRPWARRNERTDASDQPPVSGADRSNHQPRLAQDLGQGRSERRPAGQVTDLAEAADSSGLNFDALGLPGFLVRGLQERGITTPFPIQAATIPDALAGRNVLGRGQTGSGKTLAFGLPLIARLTDGPSGPPRAIVLVPTRELAMQVTDALAPLARAGGLSVALVAGGMSYTPQIRAFERGVDVVVATPGRLIDLLEQGVVDLSRVEIAVLDEADHMADLGFMPAVTTLMDAVPSGGQRLLFSATLDGAVDRLVRTYLTDPVTHEVDSGQASVTTMDHRVLHVLPHHKTQVTAEIAGREGRTVVFARTQLGAERVADQLRSSGVMAGALHGGLNQGARNRVLGAFKDGHLPVLVATDVAARGIHVDDVGLVLQVDPPAGPKEYLHRAGRTARAGGRGVVVTLALPHQRREVSKLASQAGVSAAPVTAHPGDDALAAVTGARTPSGESFSTADYERLIAPKPARQGHRGGRSGGRGYGDRGRDRFNGRAGRGGR
jgi:superfamily II DNA/RNA helicase